MFKFKNLGKTRIPHRKNTAALAAVKMPAPKEICLPMIQHIGAPATPVVKVGDTVKVGQLVADACGYVSSPIYSSVSGTVSKIDVCLKSDGKTAPAIYITSDGLMTPHEDISVPEITDIDSLSTAIRQSGLVGLGGAGFPTSVKFDALKKGGINTLIINAAECEPYITGDARTMLDDSASVYEGVMLLKRVAPEIKEYVIGIEDNKPECIEKMTDIFASDPSVTIKSLPSLYPQGAEKILIYNATGRVVPEGKLPADVGVIVVNVTTLATFAKYAKTGMPLVERCITVDGSAINEPKNVIAPIGTSIADIIEFAGGFKEYPGKVILGGPMTGRAIYTLDEPIVKTSGAIIALTDTDSIAKESSECIHCGKCVDACPNSLNPTAISKAMRMDNLDEKMQMLKERCINLCIECGCCSFVCPANRPLLEYIRINKSFLRDYEAHKKSLK